MSTFDGYSQADTIPISTALSAGASINNMDVVGLVMPAAWDTAVITLSQSLDGVTWNNVYDQNGTEITLQAVAGRYISLPPSLLAATGFLRIRSGTSGTPVNQTAARTLSWLMKNYGR